MKKTVSHVVSLAFALLAVHALAGDADTSPLRLSPVKIPKCQKAHVCQDLPCGGRQVGKGAAPRPRLHVAWGMCYTSGNEG